MARSHYIKKARKDIYQNGKRVQYVGKKGSKREGQTLERVDRTKPENKADVVLIKKGQPYWWWQFRFGPKIISATPPRRSRLTRSGFLSALYDLEDDISRYAVSDEELEDFTSSDFQSTIDDWINQIDELQDECQYSLDNMPEHLQDTSDSGMMLTERIEALSAWRDELQSLDIEFEETDDLEQKRQAIDEIVQRLQEVEVGL